VTPDSTGVRPTVRRAGAGDSELLAALLADAERDMTNYRGGDVMRTEIASEAATRDHPDAGMIRLVSEVGGIVVGMLLAVSTPGIVTVVRVYVTPDARAHGCGDAMIAALLDEAKHCGAERVDGWALPGDRETKNLYERNGLTARAIIASRRLSDN
jgi:GNAT superfamily N-acetyltransferase